jgi:hypothetical protein
MSMEKERKQEENIGVVPTGSHWNTHLGSKHL